VDRCRTEGNPNHTPAEVDDLGRQRPGHAWRACDRVRANDCDWGLSHIDDNSKFTMCSAHFWTLGLKVASYFRDSERIWLPNPLFRLFVLEGQPTSAKICQIEIQKAITHSRKRGAGKERLVGMAEQARGLTERRGPRIPEISGLRMLTTLYCRSIASSLSLHFCHDAEISKRS
jgi:hypothetical protein